MNRAYVFISFCLVFLIQGENRLQGQDRPLKENLANVLARMAHESNTPLVAELAQPLPTISAAEGMRLTSESLNRLAAQAPGYEWEKLGSVIHFYDKRLHRAQFNFLNKTFRQFTVPPNLSEFKIWFPGRATGLLEGFTSEGGATTGFGDAQLKQHGLKRETLKDQTARAVLIHVANESPTFYAILVFPNASPTKTEAKTQVSWQWSSLDAIPKPIYSQPNSKKK